MHNPASDISLQSLTIPTPLGQLKLTASDHGLVAVARTDTKASAPEITPSSALLQHAAAALGAYFTSRTSLHHIPLDLRGTLFQQRVWNILLAISFGSTISYSEVAARLGTPSAYRAVANACGANPLPIFIPCHRVVHKDGTWTGFTWGKDVKRFLLAHENTFHHFEKHRAA